MRLIFRIRSEYLIAHLMSSPFEYRPLSQFYLPFPRTFYQSNGRYRDVKTTVNVTAEDGSVNATEIVEKVPEENIIKYLPHGNYKW